MVRIKKPKQYPNAAAKARAAAFFCCYAKIGELNGFLRNHYGLCLNSEKETYSATILKIISSLKKGVVSDNGTAPFFCSTKNECFHCKISPSAFAFDETIIRRSTLSPSGPPYLPRAPPLLKSRFNQISERGGLPYGKTISQKNRTL